MTKFDEHIRKIRDHIDSICGNGCAVRVWDCPESVEGLRTGLPVQVAPGANPGIVLRSDTFAELGNPQAGSVSILLWTDDPSLLQDSRVTLIGPDIPEAEGSSLPFGQIILLGGTALDGDKQEALEQNQHISDQLEGYMVRSSPQNIWGRVSKDAAAKGFTLETLGRALMIVMKSNVPEVEAMEVFFITSGKDEIRHLEEIAAEISDIRKEIVKEYWKSKGYDLECDLDCGSCDSKTVCDDVKEMIRARKEKEPAE